MLDDRHKVTKLLVGQGLSGVGDGLWFSIWAIYLTGFSAISPGLMGIAIGITGLIGVALAYPAGGFADHYNVRDIFLALTIIRAIGMIGFCFVSGPVSLLAASFAVFGTQSAVAGVRVALVCGLFPSERRQIDVLAKTWA